MKKATYEDLVALQRECAGLSDPEELLRWIDGVGIARDGLREFSHMVGDSSAIAAKMALDNGWPPEDFFAAVFMSGMELGIRYQQSREVKL